MLYAAEREQLLRGEREGERKKEKKTSLKERRRQMGGGMSPDKIFLLTIRFVFWDVALLTLWNIPEQGPSETHSDRRSKEYGEKTHPISLYSLVLFCR